MKPVQLGDTLREYHGLWVALKNGKVVEAQRTPDALYRALKDREIRGATIVRAPNPGEALKVGLG